MLFIHTYRHPAAFPNHLVSAGNHSAGICIIRQCLLSRLSPFLQTSGSFLQSSRPRGGCQPVPRTQAERGNNSEPSQSEKPSPIKRGARVNDTQIRPCYRREHTGAAEAFHGNAERQDIMVFDCRVKRLVAVWNYCCTAPNAPRILSLSKMPPIPS